MNWQDFLYNQFPRLLSALHADTKPLWGAMTAQHVAEHLAYTISFANGKNAVSVVGEVSAEKLAYRKQRFFAQYVPMPKGVQVVFKGLPPLMYADFGDAKAQVFVELERLQDYLAEHPDISTIHPYFGSISVTETIEFQARHILHHCVQFGLTTAPGY
jgi:hydroxymethylglutaryl-CoA reductase